MARIAGIDIPKNKRGVIGLTYIYGIGSSRAALILDQAGISHDKKVNEWNDDELASIRNFICKHQDRRRIAFRGAIEHQAIDGHWLLPWTASP